ncbi:uncharacterized protein LOC143275686 [Babylonia areolata]|uniref:uncharacterized protein LOC143275686 n=1 Tax=Babylonia areolata TaxID=304850 RepID=UPI003FD355A0
MMTSPHSLLLPLHHLLLLPVLLLLLLLPLHFSLAVTGETPHAHRGCDTQTASDCLRYSEVFMASQLEEQFAECTNASKSVACLEAMIARCPSLAQEDEMLHTMITRHVHIFKAEAASVCSSATTVVTSWMSAVTSTTLVTLLCLHVVVIL